MNRSTARVAMKVVVTVQSAGWHFVKRTNGRSEDTVLMAEGVQSHLEAAFFVAAAMFFKSLGLCAFSGYIFSNSHG